MFGIGERFGTLVIAAALLFAAMRVHKSSGKHSKVTKPVGVVLAFLAGAAMLVSVAGDWMAKFASTAGTVGVAGLIVCVVIVAVDWFADNKPDRPAFWAAFFLSMFIVFGVAQVPKATGQVNKGVTTVGNKMSTVNNQPAPPKKK